MDSIGYLVSFATALFGILIGRFWKLFDYYNSKDRKLLEEVLVKLPDEKMVELPAYELSDAYADIRYLFLKDFLDFCNFPRVRFFNKTLEKHKNSLIKLISTLPFDRKFFIRSSSDFDFAIMDFYSLPNNEEGQNVLDTLNSIHKEYVKFINKSRKI